MRGRDIFIACDDDFCGEEIHCEHGWDTYAEQVKQAREDGWSVGKRDYCPEHRHLARHRNSVSVPPLDDGLGPHLGY